MAEILKPRILPDDSAVKAPAMDMFEKEDSYIISMELPGAAIEDIDISMMGDTLTIRGERKAPEDTKFMEWQCCERCYGRFTRTVAIPKAVDADKIEASFENGVLEITLPKSEEYKSGRIEIKATPAPRCLPG